MTERPLNEFGIFFTTTPSTSTPNMSIAGYTGIGVTVFIFLLSICCTCYRLFIRRKSFFPTLNSSENMRQPLIPAVSNNIRNVNQPYISTNMNYEMPNGNMGPGYRLGGTYRQQHSTYVQNYQIPPGNMGPGYRLGGSYPQYSTYVQNQRSYQYGQPPLPINHPLGHVQQNIPALEIRPQDNTPAINSNTGLQNPGNTTGTTHRPIQLEPTLIPEPVVFPEEDFFELPNDPPPEPDHNNPFSVEAITYLVALHQTRQIPAMRIEVNRETIVEDLIQIYQTMDQWQAHSGVFCKFKGEEGLDAGGVMKDLYTTFWDKAKDIYFKGNVAYVPQINLRNYDLSVFVTLGRIFSHSTVLLRAVPLQICRTTLLGIIFGEMEMVENTTDTSDLIEDFMLYIDLDDRLLLQKAMKHFDELNDTERMKLQYIFETFDMTNTPKTETLEANLSVIAYNELYVKPRVVCQKMGQGLPTIHREYFWGHLTLCHINALYAVFRLTPNMVIEKLVCDRLLSPFSRERKSYNNLKRFIKDLSEDLLLKFLQFVTGERKVPSGVIVVHFTDQTGVRRAPRSHTCMNILELPRSYTNFNDLKRVFTNVLQSDEAMQILLE